LAPAGGRLLIALQALLDPEVYMRVRRPFTALVALGLSLVIAACSALREDTLPSPFDGGSRGTPSILITVDNQDFRDATLYANWNGVRHRVGTVTGKTTETLETPWREHVVQLEVDFLGGGEMKAWNPIQVQSGDHLDFVIMPEW
jgi:hypothetical protein